MPASELGWAVAEKLPIFQVYGTKRKAEDHQNGNVAVPWNEIEPNFGVKKKRVEENDMMTDGAVAQPVDRLSLEVNHNDPGYQGIQPNAHPFTCASVEPVETESMDTQGCMDFSIPMYQSVNICTPVDPTSLSAHHVNNPSLNGAISDMPISIPNYDPLQQPDIAENETVMNPASFTMDTDYVPDRQQYRQNRMVYCDDYCVDGEPNPKSCPVNCFCHHNWGEMSITSRPYIAGYY